METKERKAEGAEEMTFERALARLEEILTKLESGEASLDESLALFEEGVALSKLCNGMLDRAEQKVLMFERGADGEPQLAEWKGGEG